MPFNSPVCSVRRNRFSGRTALLVGAAALPLALASTAHAQSTVVLEEGGQPRAVALGPGNDRLVVDIARVNADTAVLDLTGLTTGPVTNTGGQDEVWLRASSSQTRNVVFTTVRNGATQQYVRADSASGAPFEGGTVYEASGNDTVLTLENRSRSTTSDLMPLPHGPLRLTGDGAVVVAFAINAADQPNDSQQAIRIEGGSTLQSEGKGGDGRLDVIIDDDVGGDVTPSGLIDAREANSLRITKNARVQILQGTAIMAGEADLFLDAGGWVNSTNARFSNIDLITSSGRVYNSTRVSVGGQNGDPTAGGNAFRLNGGKLYNILTEAASGQGPLSGGVGNIIGGESAVVVGGDDYAENYIENVGDIKSFTGAAIRSENGTSVLRNTVWNYSKGGSRAGVITGGLVNGVATAYQDVGDTVDAIVNSGAITGDVDLGIESDMFLYTGATHGVTGAIAGGDDIDGYGKSLGASGAYQLANDILGNGNSSFEMHGIEIRGADTEISVTSAAGLDAGLMVVGEGSLINTSAITNNTDSYGVWVRNIANMGTGLRFTNRGDIRTRLDGFRGEPGLASFTNEKLIHSSEGAGATLDIGISEQALAPFQFNNSGAIETESDFDSAVSLTVKGFAATGPAINFANSGTIRNTGEREVFRGAEQSALEIRDASGRDNGHILANSGLIEGTGRGTWGISFKGSRIDATNTGTIQTSGDGARAVQLFVGRGSVPSASSLINSGTISAKGRNWDDGGSSAVSLAVGVSLSAEGSRLTLQNDGTIEAANPNGGAAIYVDASGINNRFTLVNRGTILGLGERSFAGVVPDINLTDKTLSGAIETVRTIDGIENRGTIAGDIDLNEFDDEFRNYGNINRLNLGSGNDSYVFGQGGTIVGDKVYGAEDYDTIRVDLTGDADKRIDAGKFSGFEELTTLSGTSGAGKVYALGTFDVDALRLRNIVLNIAAGDRVSSANGNDGDTFIGSEEKETINNAGEIEGGVSLGGGDDIFNNSGTVGRGVGMGAGNDVVVNSGTITGSLDLGLGDDRYEARSGGLVGGTIDGGDGTDTFVFRLNGNSGSIPGGFTNFESFGAYGPGTLSLALNQNYDTIELYEGANLTLSDGTGTVGQIKGDDSAQIVTIEDADFGGGVALAGGDDTLGIQLNGALAGALDGGSGTDTLKLALTGASSIHDLFNFEIVDVTGASPLTLTGTLGAGQKINFDGADNRFIVDTGATFQGSANGGDGTDTIEINTGAANSRTIVAGQLVSFEKLVAGGAGTLALNGQAYSFDSVDIAGNLSIGDGASLASANGIHFGGGDNRLTLEGTGAVSSPVDGGAGTDTLAFSLAAGQTRNLSSAGTLTGFEQLAARGPGTLVVDQNANYQAALIEGGHLSIASGATLTAPVGGSAQADTLSVAAGGALFGAVDLGAGNDVVNNAGTITGDVNLGDGDDRYIARSGGVVTGMIDGGAGNNTFVFNLENATGSLPGSVVNFNSFGVYGPGTLTVNLDAGQTYQNLEILEGANLVLSGTNGSVANVIGDDSAQSVTIDGALTGGVSLGGGDDSLTMHLSGLLDGALDGGAGNDTLNLTLDGASSINGMFGFETANIAGASPLTLTGDLGADQRVNFTGSTDNELIIGADVQFDGVVDGGAGHDLLRIQSGAAQSRTVLSAQILSFEDLISEGAGTLALFGEHYGFDSVAVNGGNLEIGTGTVLDAEQGVTFDGADNRLTLRSGAQAHGRIDGGAGNDTLAFFQTAGTARLFSALDQTGFERLETTGGELRIDRDATFANGVGVDGGALNILAGNRLTANVAGGVGKDEVVVAGRIEGNLDLGAGDDRLIVSGAGAISGTRSGGEGVDALVFNTGGTTTAPTQWAAAAYDGFERAEIAGGVVSFTGTASLTGLTVSGGRLIGQAGSVLSSVDTIVVGQGATFGSAGTVNGNIDVRGTLAPGASPGTMTVNGNVNFASGSVLQMEVSSAASDLLNISGKLTIAQGAAMDITGALSATPGGALDLVVAQGGITGGFTTINKSNTIFGFVATRGNRIQILGAFQSSDAFSVNAQGAIAYANDLLGDGKMVQTFTGALPSLVSASGQSNAGAFERLTPEAYATAQMQTVQAGLAVTETMRNLRAAAPIAPGLHGFAQALGQWNRLSGNAATGASAARSDLMGLIGGVGYGFGEGSRLGAFVGTVRSTQNIADLGAENRQNGALFGALADLSLGGFDVHALIAYDRSHARTRRAAPTGDAITARYGTGGIIGDLSIGYGVDAGGLMVTPRVGLTYVEGKRETFAERSAPFGLSVDGDSAGMLYGDTAVAVSFDLGGIKPYAEAGVRSRLAGDALPNASAHFTAASGTGPLLGLGAGADRTVGRIALGFGAEVSVGVRLNLGYTGEYGSKARHNVSGGVAIAF